MVDRNVRVLFFQPNGVDQNSRNFADCLDYHFEQGETLEYTQCAGGLMVRVERLEYTRGFWKGDFVRQQTDNLPPIAHDSQPLTTNPNPAGHRAAFLYSADHNILGIQSGRPGVSTSAVNSFMRNSIRNHRGFFMDPCLSSDAFERLAAGSPRKVEMRIARPNDLARVDPTMVPLEDGLTALQDFVDGQVIDLSVGFSRSEREALLNRDRLLELFRWGAENRAQVKKMKIKIQEEDDPIDMFAERVDKRATLNLDPDDLDAAFVARIEFIEQAFEERMEELVTLYGQTE